jgi:hypothetical protein
LIQLRAGADGDYVVESINVTATLLSHLGDGRTRDIVTAVNTGMENQSIRWEKVRFAPRKVGLLYDRMQSGVRR